MKVVRAFLVLALFITMAPGALAAPLNPSGRSFTPAVQSGEAAEYVVVYASRVSLRKARKAVQRAGGEIVKENAKVRVATVRSSNPDFLAAVAAESGLLVGAMRNHPVSQIEPGAIPMTDPEVERIIKDAPSASAEAAVLATDEDAEPLAGLQWGMAMIHATVDGSYAVDTGSPRVLVGIIDSGIDGGHPDIAPNFNLALSRNFATDIELIDGPCEYTGCIDPPNVDNNGHGTHVAGIVAAALNGLGLAGVAPTVTLVNIRGGQDSGYVFLQPVVDALVYAGDIGVDVVNMSFYIDPWLYNCPANPADSPEAQMEQRTVIAATQNAVNYARAKGVTLVVSAGNSHTDLGNPTADASSPDFPPGSEYFRTVDNSCLSMPVEAEGVIAISAIGPSMAKADYSNYGIEQINFAAPGGYFRDLLGTPRYRTNENLILSTFPKSVLEADGLIDPVTGEPLTASVIRDCQNGVCAYYAYLQGTSMASPHATGVAALAVSRWGKPDKAHPGGIKLKPDTTLKLMNKSAVDTPCPVPPLMDYTPVGRPAEFNAYCEGAPGFNGFYGEGIVDALNVLLGDSGSK